MIFRSGKVTVNYKALALETPSVNEHIYSYIVVERLSNTLPEFFTDATNNPRLSSSRQLPRVQLLIPSSRSSSRFQRHFISTRLRMFPDPIYGYYSLRIISPSCCYFTTCPGISQDLIPLSPLFLLLLILLLLLLCSSCYLHLAGYAPFLTALTMA